MSSKFKRSKKLVNSGLQLRLIGAFGGVAAMACMFQVYLVHSTLMPVISASDGPPDTAELYGVLISNVVLTFAVLFPLMLVVGILITHRVAGPIYRFEQHLGAIARGENPGVCRIRKGDELQSLCTAINAAMPAMVDKTDASDERQAA
tara:strand:+ start:5434 stop:5877 length:444 start_codon:yes stop_codon:yes gene_type:complete